MAVRSWVLDGKSFGLTAADADFPMLPEGAYFRNFPIMMGALGADMALVAARRDAVAVDRTAVQELASLVEGHKSVVMADRLAADEAASRAELAAETAVTAAYPLEPDEVAGVPSVLYLVLTDAMALPVGSFSRLSSAPYWDAAGVLRTAAAGVPRFDHDPATGRLRGLLLQGTATNLLLRSQEFDHVSWSKTGVSVTANARTAPDGTTSMDKLVEAAASGAHRVVQSVSLISGTVYVKSVFAFAAERSALKVEFGPDGWGAAAPRVTFNLATGTVQSVIGTATRYGIESCGGGLYRVWVAALATSTSGSVYLMLGNSASGEADAYTGDGSSGLYLWGAQLEAGEVPTSYIATAGSTATRAADLLALDTAGWLAAGQGTMAVETERVWTSTVQVAAWLGAEESGNDRISVAGSTGVVRTGGVNQAQLANTYPAVGTLGQRRQALAWAANDFAFCEDGGTVLTDTSGSVPDTPTLYLGTSSLSAVVVPLNGWLHRVTVFPRRLSDATLQLLTAG